MIDNYEPASDPRTIRSDLLSALDAYDSAHRRCEVADREYRQEDDHLSNIKTLLIGEIAADKTFTNDASRKAEFQRRLSFNYGHRLEAHAKADAERRTAQAELERAEAYVKTLRAVLYFDAEAMRLQAEQVAAARIAATAEQQLAEGMPGYDIPF